MGGGGGGDDDADYGDNDVLVFLYGKGIEIGVMSLFIYQLLWSGEKGPCPAELQCKELLFIIRRSVCG